MSLCQDSVPVHYVCSETNLPVNDTAADTSDVRWLPTRDGLQTKLTL